MNLSYWEIKSWLHNIHFTIVGSGIVGLSCAINLKKRFPKANILILEKGYLPQGASTKNAGFACFGSLSEIIDDLNHHSETEVVEMVKNRQSGLQLLRQTLGDKQLNYKHFGGYELFLNQDNELYDNCVGQINFVNQLLAPIFNNQVFSITDNKFKFNKIMPNYCFNKFEAQIDTGKMMQALLLKALKSGIKILNTVSVENFKDNVSGVQIKTNHFEFSSSKLLIATNGFASQLLHEQVQPARAQVLITKPIKNLHIKGTFHLDKGYYYFRNIDNRILFGGGRNLDFKTENTTEFGQTILVQNTLETYLKEVILPNSTCEIDHRWSGIMGVGVQKRPIVKQISNNVFCGVRLGGMGIAIGSNVGKALSDLVE